MCVVQFIGPSRSGKTSAIILVARRLKSMGFRVAVLKHTHHHIDTPGKDSWRYVEEGYVDYSIVFRGSGDRVAIFMRDKSLESILEELMNKVDVILIEGFKNLELGYRIMLSHETRIEDVIEDAMEYMIKCLSKNLKP